MDIDPKWIFEFFIPKCDHEGLGASERRLDLVCLGKFRKDLFECVLYFSGFEGCVLWSTLSIIKCILGIKLCVL